MPSNRFIPNWRTRRAFRGDPACSRLYILAAYAIGAILLAGCSMGYMSLRPGENHALYKDMFADLISYYDEPHWLWVRGVLAGDYDGDGKVDEEAVIATIQRGTERNPGPIESAYLIICKNAGESRRSVIARTQLFDRNPIPDAPRPEYDVGWSDNLPLRFVRAQIVPGKLELSDSVVVYFWGQGAPTSVWYAGFKLKDDRLEMYLDCVLWQSTQGFATANLDRRISPDRKGFQLLFPVAAIPESVAKQLGTTHETPLWGHVYARGDDGMYRQADEKFGESYKEVEAHWNQTYLRAVITEMPPQDLAWLEYHMGLMNHYIGNDDLAQRFLDKAGKNAADPLLFQAVEKARRLVAEPAKQVSVTK